MVKKISTNFWCLRTEFNECKGVFFGRSEGEVLGKYRAWVRNIYLSKWRVI